MPDGVFAQVYRLSKIQIVDNLPTHFFSARKTVEPSLFHALEGCMVLPRGCCNLLDEISYGASKI